MKRKFQICINASGRLNDAFLRILTNHADGRINADFDLLEAFAKTEYAQYPTITGTITLKHNEGNNSLDIYENEKHTMTIYEKVYFDLHPVDQEIEKEL